MKYAPRIPVLIALCVSLLLTGCKKRLPFGRDAREAIENDKAATLKVLIDAGVDVNAKDETGRTPLSAAVHSRAHPEITELLLDSGADPNQPDGQGEFALNIALQNGEAENAQSLLKHGADPNHANREGLSALAYIEPFLHSQSGVDAVDALLQKGAKADGQSGARALEAALREGNVPAAQKLIGVGARVESNAGNELLHEGVGNGNYEIVELLLDSGVSPNSWTPGAIPNLYLAVHAGTCVYANSSYARIVDILLSKGANLDAGYAGQTPLSHAEFCIANKGTTPQSLAIIHALQIAGVSADARQAARRSSMLGILRRTYHNADVPIPEQFWSDIGIKPTAEVRKYSSAQALNLSSGEPPALAVEVYDPDLSGSGGAPIGIYGLRSGVAKDGRAWRKYALLLNSYGGPQGVHILDSTTNGYADLLIDASSGGSIFKFDGTSYKETECFSHDYNTLDNFRFINCPVVP
jgi:ankyrin repeat protein